MKPEKIQNFFKNKVIVIIGAAGGIGRTLLTECSKYTDKLVITGRNIDKLKSIAKELNISNIIQLDISDINQIPSAVDEIEQNVGPIDISFNFSGYDVFKKISDISSGEIINTCRINFEGPMFYTQYLIKKYMTREKGIIANVNAFSNGLVPFPFYSIDSASRAGVANYFRALRRELHVDYPDIRLISFSPPITDTATERSRISSRVWELEKMKFHSPESVVLKIMKGIVNNKNEIMNLDEKLLQIAEQISPKISDLTFFNKFIRLSKKILSK